MVGWPVLPLVLAKSTRSLGLFAAFFSYTLGVQDGGLACPSSLVLAKSTRSLGLFAAFFSYTLGVQDGGLACPSSLVLARSLGLFSTFTEFFSYIAKSVGTFFSYTLGIQDCSWLVLHIFLHKLLCASMVCLCLRTFATIFLAYSKQPTRFFTKNYVTKMQVAFIGVWRSTFDNTRWCRHVWREFFVSQCL